MQHTADKPDEVAYWSEEGQRKVSWTKLDLTVLLREQVISAIIGLPCKVSIQSKGSNDVDDLLDEDSCTNTVYYLSVTVWITSV